MKESTMTQKEQKVFRKVQDFYTKSKDEFNRFYDECNTAEELYWCYIDPNKHGWRSKVFDPETFRIVEKTVAHLTATAPKGKFIPSNYEEPKKVIGAQILDALFREFWTNPKANTQSALGKTIKSMSLFGIGVMLAKYRYETKVKTTETEQDGEVVVTTENEVVYDAPFWQDLYVYDCYFDPEATSMEDMEAFAHDEWTTVAALEAKNSEKIYKNLGKLKAMLRDKKTRGTTSGNEYRDNSKNLRFNNTTSPIRTKILVRRYYTRSRWVTIAPDFSLVLEDRRNPYQHGDLPIALFVNYEYPNSLFGHSDVTPTKTLQKALNRVINQRIDNVDMILNPMFKAIGESKFGHTWTIAPGQIMQLERGNDLQPFVFPDATGNTFTLQTNYYKSSISNSLGHYDALSKNARKDITATEIRALAGEQNAMMRAKEGNVDNALRRLIWMTGELLQQYSTQDKTIKILGAEAVKFFKEVLSERDYTMVNGEEVPRFRYVPALQAGYLTFNSEDIKGTYDFIADTGSTVMVDNQAEIEKLIQAIGIINNNTEKLASEGVDVKVAPLLEKLIKMLGIRDTEDIFKAQPESMAIEQPMQPEAAPQALALPQQDQIIY